MENSKIEWTHHTFNPWIGCTKVSDGCRFCYAEHLMDKRMGRVQWGPQGTRQRTSEANWRKPRQWNKRLEGTGQRERVFCASLADVFEDRPELGQWRSDLFDLIVDTPNLDWLLLTKRPENVLRMSPHWVAKGERIAPNIWIGTSVENQEQADKRIPELLRIPAAVRFLSCEPLLESIDLTDVREIKNEHHQWSINTLEDSKPLFNNDPVHRNRIHWVIVGGESGSNARRFDLSWAYSLKEQCDDAGVACFIKQLGGNPTSVQWGYTITDKKGGNWHEWPEDLRVRQIPQPVTI